MRIARHEDGSVRTVWASTDDTWRWARRWPCSTLRGHRFRADFDPNGDLVDFTLDGRDGDCDAHELNAFIEDAAGGAA